MAFCQNVNGFSWTVVLSFIIDIKPLPLRRMDVRTDGSSIFIILDPDARLASYLQQWCHI